MLIRFKVSNFLSFDEEQELSMIGGSTQKKVEHLINNNLKLLKFSAIYGSNASGKSNLLKAINFSKNIILGGIAFNLSNLYCRIKNSNQEKISSFEFEVEINKKFYAYGFDILLSKNSIQAEWLIELDKNKNKEVLIFSRRLGEDIEINNDYFENREDIINRLNVYYSDMKRVDSILFLTIMNRNKETLYQDLEKNNVIVFKQLFDWFMNSLTIIFPQVGLDNTPFFLSNENIEKINKIISTFGTGIKECKVIDASMQELQANIPPQILKNMIDTIEKAYIDGEKLNNEKNIQQAGIRINREMYIIKKSSNKEPTVKKIVLKHKNSDSVYEFSEESDGTQRLFDLIEILMTKSTEKVYLIDELDRCLHPTLTYEFVRRFLSNPNNINTQLIVTTHESRLLNFDLLRRDEIWFANREKNGPTNLYSLEDYNERFDKRIDKAYLEGRYGGIPIFETVFPVGDVEYENC